jgi:phosphoserine aminotransferase
MAMWSLLGPRSVDILQWESFGKGWVTDIRDQLNLADIREIKADYGLIPDLNTVDFNNDVVFTWNGTTSGVRVPDGDWIPRNRQGLTICDATSAVFAMHLPWDKLDFTTYSWQKVMGGEAQHGIIILSPRAVDRLESYSPPWPLPKIFRLTKNEKIDEAIFKGATINTPSMICVEDALDGLNWAISIGGLSALIKRSEDNLTAVKRWVENSEDIEFLAKDPRTISPTSICISIVAPWFKNLDEKEQSNSAKTICSLLDSEGAGYDIESYRDAPPGLRIWGGSTVETSDVKSLTQWIDWAMGEVAVKYL